MYKQSKYDPYEKYEDATSTKCKYCKNKLYVKIFKNKVNKMQIGLYCTKCNKWHKFINEDGTYTYTRGDVFVFPSEVYHEISALGTAISKFVFIRVFNDLM